MTIDTTKEQFTNLLNLYYKISSESIRHYIPQTIKLHKIMQDKDSWIDKWIEYKSKEQEKK